MCVCVCVYVYTLNKVINDISLIQLDSYKITVYTGTKSGSGTDATVRITMYGSNGECGPKKLDNSDNNFESGR